LTGIYIEANYDEDKRMYWIGKNCRRDQCTHDSLLPGSNTIVILHHSRPNPGEEPALHADVADKKIS
jgi:hypothetical protein